MVVLVGWQKNRADVNESEMKYIQSVNENAYRMDEWLEWQDKIG